MAKPKSVAVIDDEALTPISETALAAVPTGVDHEGMEDIDAGDLQIPQLKVCQSLSPEKDDTAKFYIAGLKDGDLFRTGTGEVIGAGPVEFIVAALDKYAAISDPVTKKFISRVDFNDERTKFGDNGEKPGADKTYDLYVILTEPQYAAFPFAILRFNKTKVPVAKNLCLQFKLAGGMSKRLFSLAVLRETNAAGQKFFNFRVSPTKVATPAQYAAAKQLLNMMQAGKVQAAEDPTGERAPVDTSDVPF